LNFANHPKNLVPNGKNRSYIKSSSTGCCSWPQYVRATTGARTHLVSYYTYTHIFCCYWLPISVVHVESLLFIINYFSLCPDLQLLLIDDDESEVSSTPSNKRYISRHCRAKFDLQLHNPPPHPSDCWIIERQKDCCQKSYIAEKTYTRAAFFLQIIIKTTTMKYYGGVFGVAAAAAGVVRAFCANNIIYQTLYIILL